MSRCSYRGADRILAPCPVFSIGKRRNTVPENRGTGTAPGSNSGALPCLFHWETQEYGPGAVALPFALCQTGTVIIWQFLLRSDVTTLRFRNSGIGRKKTCYKKVLFTTGGFKACRTLRPYAWQQSCRRWQKCVFFPIQSDEIARMPRTREHLQCTGPLVSLLDCIDSESVRMLKIGLST